MVFPWFCNPFSYHIISRLLHLWSGSFSCKCICLQNDSSSGIWREAAATDLLQVCFSGRVVTVPSTVPHGLGPLTSLALMFGFSFPELHTRHSAHPDCLAKVIGTFHWKGVSSSIPLSRKFTHTYFHLVSVATATCSLKMSPATHNWVVELLLNYLTLPAMVDGLGMELWLHLGQLNDLPWWLKLDLFCPGTRGLCDQELLGQPNVWRSWETTVRENESDGQGEAEVCMCVVRMARVGVKNSRFPSSVSYKDLLLLGPPNTWFFSINSPFLLVQKCGFLLFIIKRSLTKETLKMLEEMNGMQGRIRLLQSTNLSPSIQHLIPPSLNLLICSTFLPLLMLFSLLLCHPLPFHLS